EIHAAQQALNSVDSEKVNANRKLVSVQQEAQAKHAEETRLKAQVDAHNQAEAMRVGNMDIAAKGGYLYAQA
ncbi:hypothetical protein, partial [Escherichia coli]